MSFVRKLFALTLTAGLILQSPAFAATYFYRYGVTPAQPTAQAPSSPAPVGTFAILIDSPVPNVATIGDTYSATTYAYSSVGAVVFSVQSGALPAGVTINPSTGTIFGSPTSVGLSSAVIQGIDTATGQIATAALTIDTINAFSISGNPSAVVTVNTPYSASFSLSGGSEPYGFSVGALPSGLSFSAAASTATLAGVPTVPGTYGIAVVGSEAHGLSVQYPFVLTVADLLTISGSPPASGTVGTAYSGQLVVSGGAAPFSYALAAGTLPPGLTVKAATGIISGVPVVAGAKTGVRIKVTDASGQSAISAPFSIVISASGTQPLAISGAGTPNGVENVNYSSQFTAGGGSGGYVYALASGTLPAGLTLNSSTGLLSGMPAFGTAGTYPGISVQVTDSALHVATSNPFTLTIVAGAVPLAISGTPASSVQQGAAYAAKFTGTGGSGAGYVYAVTAGTLPPGLSLNSATGLISGTATTVGTYSGIVVRVMDSAARTASTAPFAIAVGAPPPLLITGTPTPSVNQGANYSAVWTAFDGSGAGYHFTSVGAPLPPGLTLSDVNGVQGLLSGTATVSGTYSGLRIQVEDSQGNTALSNLFTVTVVPTAIPSDPLMISGVAGGAQVGESYAAQFAASGGLTPYTYAVASGALPDGLTLNSATGLISGTPVVAGTSSGITISVSDGAGATVATAPFSISVTDPSPLTISWAPQTNWQVGDFVAEAVTASGGDTANYVFSVNGTLPSGLSLYSSGALFGVLDEPGTFGPFSVTVSDGVRTATTDSVTFTVAYPGLFVSGFPPYNATEGVAYAAQYTAQGGSGSGYIYSMVGILPAGLSLDSQTGLISGTPVGASAGTYSNLAVKVVDDGNNTAMSAVFSINVQAPAAPLIVAGSPSSSATVGSSYSATFVASGGSGSGYAYSIIGTLPAGLGLNASTGVLSGVPAVGSVGSYGGLKVHVVDGMGGEADSATFSIVVHPAPTPLTVSGSPSSAATVGTAYNAAFSASGGSGSGYVYSMIGTLPAGLALNAATGAIFGTPTISSVGSHVGLKVHVVDGAGNQADSAPFSIIVGTPPLPLIVSGTPSGTAVENSAYSAAFVASGGSGSGYVYSIIGTLPAGLALNTSTGVLSGVPSVGSAGSYTGLKIHVVDGAGGQADSALFSIIVSPASLTLAGSPSSSATEGSAYAAAFVASGGSGSGYVYSITGTLPSGLSLNPVSGVLSGTPAVGSAGSYSGLRVHVGDSGGNQADSAIFTIVVAPAPTSPLVVSGAPSGAAIEGVGYLATFVASGGSGSGYVYSVVGTLPSGLQINSATGLLYGVPASGSVGTYANLKVHATDGAGHHADSPTFTLYVTPQGPDDGALRIVGPLSAAMTEGVPGEIQFVASGGSGTGYVFMMYRASELVNDKLPDGLSIDPDTGIISGTPAPGSAGSYRYLQVKVIDSEGNIADSSLFRLTVAAPGSPLTVDGTPYLESRAGYAYPRVAFVAAGGSGSGYTYSMVGTFPPGLTLDPATGVLSGMSAYGSQGTYSNLKVHATDSLGNEAETAAFNIKITAADPLQITGTPGDAMEGKYYRFVPKTIAGTGVGYVFSAIGLPTWASLDPATGALSGTPPVQGFERTHTGIRITVKDSLGNQVTLGPLNVTVLAAGAPMTLSYSGYDLATVGTNYSSTFQASGGSGRGYSYQFVGIPPRGLLLVTSNTEPAYGAFYGIPSTEGVFKIWVRATDSVGNHATSEPFMLKVTSTHNSYPPSPTGVGAITGKVGQNMNVAPFSYVPGGGTPPYRYVFPVNGLPPGLSGDPATGRIYGVPTQVGTFPIGVRLADSEDVLSEHYGSTTLTIQPADPLVFGGVPLTATQNQPYSYSLTELTTGGTAPFNYALTSGVLPDGLSMAANGTVSGVPTGPTTTPTITVTDAFGKTASSTLTFAVASGNSNVFAWGYNGYGQLGDSTLVSKSTRASVLGGKTYTQISAGVSFACGIVTDGTVDCWGANFFGQLGNGTTTASSTPVQVSGLTGVTAISAGSAHVCAISMNSLYCWGYNGNGQLGNGNTTHQRTPIVIFGLSKPTMISAGNAHTCAIVSGGTAYCWGYNGQGQLGTGDTTSRISAGLVQVQAVGTATMISAGNRHSCAVFTGKVACWGGNDLGQIGDGSTIQRNSPVYVAGLTSNITALASAPGAQHTCVVQSGAVKCWGLNASGQAGNGTTTSPQKSPVTAMASGVTKVSVGGNNSCAVQNGALRCWGSNVEGQVGDGTTTQRTSSVAVIGGEGLSSVSVGGDGDQSFVVAK